MVLGYPRRRRRLRAPFAPRPAQCSRLPLRPPRRQPGEREGRQQGRGRHLYFRHRDAIIRKSTFWQNAETFIVAQSSEETRSERGFERSTLSPASL